MIQRLEHIVLKSSPRKSKVTNEDVNFAVSNVQVNDVYGDSSFEDALADRQSSLGHMSDIISKVINK